MTANKFERYIFFNFSWIWFIYEASAGFLFEKQSVMSFLFGGIFSIYGIYMILKYKIHHKWLNPFYLFWLYIFLRVLFSSELEYSLKVFSQSFLAASFLPLGFYFIRSLEDIIRLSKSLLILALVYISNALIANALGLGGTSYGGDEVVFGMGNIFTTGLNSMTYVLVLVPWASFLVKNKLKLYFIYSISFIAFITLLLSAKRISISGVVLGYAILFLLSKRRIKLIRIVVLLTIVGILTFPYYSDKLYRQMEIRQEQLTIEGLEKEGRLWESEIVWGKIFSHEDYLRSFFGTEMFNSPFNYGIDSDRQLHVDYNVILWGGGIFGFILYLYFHLIILKTYLKLYKFRKKRENNIEVLNHLNSIFIAYFVLSFYISLSGGINGIVFNAIKNSMLGGIIGYLYYFERYSIDTKLK